MKMGDIDLEKLFWLIFIGLITLTLGWNLIQSIFNIDKTINFGLGWLLMLIAGTIMGAFILMQRAQEKSVTLNKANLVIMLIAIGILIFLLLNIKQLVPSIFTEAVYDLQSIFGMV